MNLIVFDLEMNRYNTEHHFTYHGAPQSLRGEVVQIGAVKIDLHARVLDTFTVDLRPEIFTKLSPFVAKVTGLTQQQLDAGVPMQKGLASFVEWCGSDVALLEWGMDDAPVLKQNLYLNGLDEQWPAAVYDLQHIFCRQFPLKAGDKLNLEAVITRLGLPMERTYHNALADALYTADICGRLDLAAGLAQYPTEAQQLRLAMCTAPQHTYVGFAAFGPCLTQEAWDDVQQVPAACCPVCGGALCADKDGIWARRGKNSRYTLQTCAVDGAWLLREKSIQLDGLYWSFGRVFEPADKKTMARFKMDRERILFQRRAAAQAAAEAEMQTV